MGALQQSSWENHLGSHWDPIECKYTVRKIYEMSEREEQKVRWPICTFRGRLGLYGLEN
jgi:hypothetical protein